MTNEELDDIREWAATETICDDSTLRARDRMRLCTKEIDRLRAENARLVELLDEIDDSITEKRLDSLLMKGGR